MAKKKASRKPALTKKVHVPFEEWDTQEIVSRAADVLGKFAFPSTATKATIAKSTKWPRLSEACREVISRGCKRSGAFAIPRCARWQGETLPRRDRGMRRLHFALGGETWMRCATLPVSCRFRIQKAHRVAGTRGRN